VRIESYSGFFSAAGTKLFAVPWDCALVGVNFAISYHSTADSESGVAYVLLPGSATSLVDGQGGLIAVCRMMNNLVTNGMFQSQNNLYVPIPEPGVYLSKGTVVTLVIGLNGGSNLSNICVHFRVK